MQKELKIVAFEGGALNVLDPAVKGREAVLALPLSRLLVKMIKVPAEADPIETALPVLKEMSPFPDDPLAVSCELVGEVEQEKIMIAAALPESAADDIAEALDAAKLSVVRVDALVLGQLRALWNRFEVTDGKRRLIKIKSVDGTAFVVLDGDMPCALRAIQEGADVKREELLLLLEAEAFGGPKEVAETLEFEFDPADLSALEGVRARSAEAGGIDALPDTWREELESTRFKAKLVRNVATAGGIWVVIMAVLLGVPTVYGFMTDYQKGLCKDHARQYQQVREARDKTKIVEKYSDHARGALEIMKALSDRLPEGVTLSSWDFKRGTEENEFRDGGVRIKGEAEESTQIYGFKEEMDALSADEVKIFPRVVLSALQARKGMQTFDLEMKFTEEGDE